jgi:hypothetical protein
MLDIDDTLDVVARPSTAVAVQCPLRRALLSVHPCLRRLYQVGAALHRGGHEAGAQAVAGKGRSLEPELGGGSLDDGRDVARREVVLQAFNSKLVTLDRGTGNGAASDDDDGDDLYQAAE